MVPGNIMATHLLLTHGPDAILSGSSRYSSDGTTKFIVTL